MTELVTILGMALVTFGVRYITLALVVRAEMSPAMKRALRYVPVAVLSAITVPAVAAPQGIVIVTPDNAYLYAGDHPPR
ncbi:MAG: AzlD domain-containing protein [Chloroflexi bacterium]|nr:AzlD domain-containing protein [Chloroflexota bacterium]